MTDDIEHLIATMQAAMEQRPDYARNLMVLAETVLSKKHKSRAAEIARRAMAEGRGDPEILARGRHVLAASLPGYHVSMMNDARRNLAWDKALRRAILPGMQVLEIGTGAGMLALMAARAGAGTVITCETNPVAADMARELAARNGYADRIQVITKKSQDLVVGVDLERPADLLFCDIFADTLFAFNPLSAISDARQRLLAANAPAIPASASLRVALANWKDYARSGHAENACGFDISPFGDFVSPSISMQIGTPDLQLLSQPQDAFRFDFAGSDFPLNGRTTCTCKVERDGSANVIARWLHLGLDDETSLEVRPEPGAISFSRLTLFPLDRSFQVRAGEEVDLGALYSGSNLHTWLHTRPGES